VHFLQTAIIGWVSACHVEGDAGSGPGLEITANIVVFSQGKLWHAWVENLGIRQSLVVGVYSQATHLFVKVFRPVHDWPVGQGAGQDTVTV
jgi:hypothetical protein